MAASPSQSSQSYSESKPNRHPAGAAFSLSPSRGNAYNPFGSKRHFFGERMGKRIAAKITGVAGWVPPRIVTNHDLAKIVDTSDEWIRERTGIRQRHYADPGMGS